VPFSGTMANALQEKGDAAPLICTKEPFKEPNAPRKM
jgi:hypothetical protein